MGVDRIAHIGIATLSLEESLTFYRDTLGLELVHREDVAEQGVRVAKLAVGDTYIELLEPLSDDSPVARFLERKGPGIHHIAYHTDDLRGDLRRLEGQGVRLVDSVPRRGAGGSKVAFLHPSATGKVLTELCGY